MDVTCDDTFIVGSKITPRFLIVALGNISVSPMIILLFSNRYVLMGDEAMKNSVFDSLRRRFCLLIRFQVALHDFRVSFNYALSCSVTRELNS